MIATRIRTHPQRHGTPTSNHLNDPRIRVANPCPRSSETFGLKESDDAFDGASLGWTIEYRPEVVELHPLENGEACCECQILDDCRIDPSSSLWAFV
jgi:hypothetical protein